MSWLSKGLKKIGVRIDSHTLGNLVKNVSPALAFTPVGVIGAGLAGAVGGKLRGESTGQALKSGVSNAAIGGTAKLASGAIKGALAHGTPSAVPSVAPGGGLPIPADANLTHAVIPSGTAPIGSGGPGLGIRGAIGKVGGFIEKHPTATAMGLQSIGNLATAGTQNRMQSAQATLLEQEVAEAERRRKNQLELAPAFGSLGTALGQSLAQPVATNPYGAR